MRPLWLKLRWFYDVIVLQHLVRGSTFLAVSFFCYGLHLLMMYSLVSRFMISESTANIVTYLTIAVVNFAGNYFITWRDTREYSNEVVSFGKRFISFYALVLLVSVVNYVSFDWLNSYMHYLVATTVSMGLALGVKYIIGHLFIFKKNVPSLESGILP